MWINVVSANQVIVFGGAWSALGASGTRRTTSVKSLRIIARRFGGPEVLEVVQEEPPEPGRGEVRVRELVAGVSFADLLIREGIHPEKTTLPFTPGMGHRGCR